MEGLLIIPTANAPPSGGPPQPEAGEGASGEDPFAAVLQDLTEWQEGQGEARPADGSQPGWMAVPYLLYGMLQAPPPLPSVERTSSPGAAAAPPENPARAAALIQAKQARAAGPAGSISRERMFALMAGGDPLVKGEVGIPGEIELQRGRASGEPGQPAGPAASAQSVPSGRVKVFDAVQTQAAVDACPSGEALPTDEFAAAVEGPGQASRPAEPRRTTAVGVHRSTAATHPAARVASLDVEAQEIGIDVQAPARAGLGEKEAPDPTRTRGMAAKALRAAHGVETTSGAVAAGGALPAVEQVPGSPVERVHAGGLVRQVEGALQRAAHAGRKSVRLRLEPAFLGRVELRVARQGDSMRVTLRAEQASTGALLQQHLGDLRQSLSGLGFDVASVTVEGHGAAMAQHGGWGEGRPTPRPAPARRRPQERSPVPEEIRPVRSDSWYVDTQA